MATCNSTPIYTTLTDVTKPRSTRELRERVDTFTAAYVERRPQPYTPPATTTIVVVEKAAQPSAPPTTVTISYGSDHPQPGEAIAQHVASLELDRSGGGGPVPPELASLRVEPPPAFDRVAYMRAAFMELTPKERSGLVADLAGELPPEARLGLAADLVADLGYRLFPER